MKSYRIVIVLFALLFVQPMSAEQPPTPASKVHPLMQMKLDRAKSILEGLALEDYEMIEGNARALRLLSMEAGWNLYQTQKYMDQSRDFRETADLIAEAAKGKDISRAALGYVTLTVRCVECHQYMRTHKTELMKFQPKE